MNAELLEFEVNSPDSKITKKPIKDLDFPRSAIIGGIIRGETGIIPLGNFHIQEGDKVVVCCLPRSITKVESFFF
jgi:trk system potassium uptake protein TrkA